MQNRHSIRWNDDTTLVCKTNSTDGKVGQSISPCVCLCSDGNLSWEQLCISAADNSRQRV